MNKFMAQIYGSVSEPRTKIFTWASNACDIIAEDSSHNKTYQLRDQPRRLPLKWTCQSERVGLSSGKLNCSLIPVQSRC